MSDTIPFLSLQQQHEPLLENLHNAALRVIDSGIYINGPETDAFSHELSSLLGLDNVVAVSNGLDAIRLILRGYIELGKLQPGQEVILPSNTYIASVLPVVENALVPVLVKPDLRTFGLDWEDAKRHISEHTGAVMTVHLYGTPSWDFSVAEEFRKNGILIIEDNAQAIGASLTAPDGTIMYTGALGNAAAFSFYPTKNIGALGDAGAVATKDGNLARVVEALKNYGSTKRYYNDFTGFNCRMDEIQAALLREKLKLLKELTKARNEAALHYDKAISNKSVVKPEIIPGMTQVWHQYVVRVKNRESLRKRLADQGISTDVHYPVSLFDQSCFRNGETMLKGDKDSREMSRQLAEEVISLPIANIKPEGIERISHIINTH